MRAWHDSLLCLLALTVLTVNVPTSVALSSSSSSKPLFEVVGRGRIASLFLRQPGSVNVARGESPGWQTPKGAPLVVATPCQAWRAIYQACPDERRPDLVWMGNGLPLDDCPGFSQTTLVVPHFAILQLDGPVVTADTSPPTYTCGPHAAFVARMLRAQGVARVERIVAYLALRIHAVRKVLWASCLWLLCHAQTPPLTVSQVHEQRSDLLEALVAELMPVVTELTGQRSSSSSADVLREVLSYMETYSQSMPEAIPSLDLALAEVADRNAVFYRPSQPLHTRLLQTHPAAWRAVRETCQQ
jgi:hypothetical protein